MSNSRYGAGWRRHEDNPILAAEAPYDRGGVADPFAIVVGDTVWVLYEAIDGDGDATIAAAHSSDGRSFERYADNPVLDEYRHHSYPATVRLGDDVYLTLERLSRTVPVWRTSVDRFPEGWTHVRDLTFADRVADPTPFVHDGTLYLAVATRLASDRRRYFNTVLALEDVETGTPRTVCDVYPADPTSTVVSERSAFPVSTPDGPVLFHQADEELAPDGLYGDGDGNRGDRVHALELRGLSTVGTTVRRSADNPVLEPTGDGWESVQVHSLSVVAFDGEWLGYYDGHDGERWRGIGLLELGERPPPVDDAVGHQRHGTANPSWSGDDPSPGLVYDDFADNSLHSRDETLPPRSESDRDHRLLRPVWTVGDGDPDPADDGVAFGPGVRHEIHRYADGRGERWTVSIRFPSGLSRGTVRLYPRGPHSLAHPLAERLPRVDGRRLTVALGRLPLVDLDRTFWRVSVDAAAGVCRLQRRRDGRTATLAAGSVETAPGEHDLSVRRASTGEVTVSWDDRRVGTADVAADRETGALRVAVAGHDHTVTLREVRVE